MKRKPTYKTEYDKAWHYVGHKFKGTGVTKQDFTDWWEATGQFHNRGRFKHNVLMHTVDPSLPNTLDNKVLKTVEESRAITATRRGK